MRLAHPAKRGTREGAYRQSMTVRQPARDDRDEPVQPDAHGVNPADLLRAMLTISPEDAAAVREDAAEAMKPGEQPPKR